jgi:hypothetical protein
VDELLVLDEPVDVDDVGAEPDLLAGGLGFLVAVDAGGLQDDRSRLMP